MSTVTSADGTKIGYETLGAGPALIIVDGAMCYRDNGPARGLAAQPAGSHTVRRSSSTTPARPARLILPRSPRR